MARSRAYSYDAKRAAILRHAADVIAAYGPVGASMSRIAEKCNVSKALLYHYYDNKEELIFDILRTHLEHLDAALVAAHDPKIAPEQNLRGLARTVLEIYRDSDNLHRVQLNAMGELSEQRAQIIKNIERSIVSKFRATIKKINPKLDADQSIVTPVTMSLFGILNWTYMWLRPDGFLDREEYADMLTDMLLDGVRSLR